MKRFGLGVACLLFLGFAAVLAAWTQDERVRVRLRFVDDAGKDIGGIVRVLAAKGDAALSLPDLLPRMKGTGPKELKLGWHVVPAGGVVTTLPRGAYRLEAVSGLESLLVHRELDLGRDADLAVTLPAVIRPEKDQLVAGNTHLHLRTLTFEQADDYLRKVPAADRLRVMFISYLERYKVDVDYITNRYPIGPLPKLSATGVLFDNGEEHRHNFEGFGEGYGHVMFLNLKKLVQPVSTGPGITGGGFDDIPLRPGIDEARRQGATVIWCHNTNGVEDVLNALTGRLDALNVFDGSRTGTFEDNYYRYLNLGLRMPISTGTDWFMYDFARVYAKVPGELSVPAWLDAVKAGRCQATNGPLLTLKIEGREVGDTLDLKAPAKIKIDARAVGRVNFQKLQLVHNGKVIRTENAVGRDSFACAFTHEMRVEAPGWFALRIDSQTKNELGAVLFAHTSPVYVTLAGKSILDVDAGLELLKQVEIGRAKIRQNGKFSAPAAQDKVLAMYDDAIKDLSDRINRAKK
jgi:hypothetical protein